MLLIIGERERKCRLNGIVPPFAIHVAHAYTTVDIKGEMYQSEFEHISKILDTVENARASMIMAG